VRSALALLLLAATAAATDRVFVETVVARPECYVGEPVRVVLRIGYDETFFERNAVQMFQREFDLPVQVDARWLRGRDPVAEGVSLVVNGEAGLAARGASRDMDGRRFAVVEITRTLLPEQPGALTLDAPVVRFVFATRFREDFLEGRVPLDRQDGSARGAARTITVRALPAEGRPARFTGAVGRFTVRAEAEPRAVDAGEPLKLTLRIEGEGNLRRFATPRLDGFADFHVYGMLDDRAAPVRTIVYDVAPLEGYVTEVPAIAFAYFDPRAAAYRAARTEPIPLTVRGDSEPAPDRSEEQRESWPGWIWALPLAAAAATWVLARRRGPAEEGGARARFEERAATDLAAAFTEYLAARLGCPPAAVIAPDLEARLAAAGVPREAAARAAALVERLVGARYGGRAEEDAATEAQALVKTIEPVRRTP
jgi:hypothetical protein